MLGKILSGIGFLIIFSTSAFCKSTDVVYSGVDTTNFLNQIVVTGTRTKRTLKDVPVVTRVITGGEIKKSSPRSLTDLLETEIPGLEVTRTEGVANSIKFQGLGANYLLILIDGERMSGETQRSNPDFNRIDIDNVERIEIVKGAMSTLYGSGAVAGVINIITKGATKPFEASLEAMYNGEGEERVGVDVGFRKDVGEKGVFTSFTTASANFKQRYFFQDTEIEGFRNFSVGEKLGYNYSDNLKLSLKGGFYSHERYNASVDGKKVKVHDLYNDYNMVFKGEYAFNPDNKLDFAYNFDTYKKFYKYLILHENDLNYRHIINNPRIMFTNTSLKNNVLTAGIEFFNESLKTYQFQTAANPEEFFTKRAFKIAGFVQDEYNITQRLALQAGVRADYHEYFSGVSVTPKLSVMYKLGNFANNLWVLRAGYSSGYRTPTLKELYTSWDHQGIFVLMGNENLKPEKSHNIQLSAEYSTKVVNVSATGFYNYMFDKISPIWNVAQDTSFYANIDKGKIFGGDVNLRLQVYENISIKCGYAYVNDKSMVDGHNTSSTRPHSATLRAEYNLNVWKINMTFGLNGKWLSAVDTWAVSDDGPNLEYTKVHYEGYTMWRFGTVVNFPRGIRVNWGVNNIFNYKPKEVTFNAGITRGTTLFAGLSIAFEELFKRNRR